jgi:hypothetical protein
MIMLRFFGTLLAVLVVVAAAGSSSALAYDSPQTYGVEIRGGFNTYDMGDVPSGLKSLQTNLNSVGIRNTVNEKDNGPSGGFSFLFKPSKHSMWEAGFNALMDVESTVDTQPDTASGQILMHANEFFVKGHLVVPLLSVLNLNVGGGVSYYNTELQIQDNQQRKYYFDAVGRGWGIVGSAGLEFLISQRVGLLLQGGGRLVNTSQFSYEPKPGDFRTYLPVPGGQRGIEVNLSGAYANLGLRFYFDRVTKPVDFTR